MKNNLALNENEEYFNLQDKRILKELLKNDGLSFSRYFFKEREGEDFIVSPHHEILSNTLQLVFDGKIKRLIINMPPGYTKTEEAVIHFMTRGLAINPKAKFIHSSYSSDLALLNSQVCRDIVESEQFQELFPMQIRDDTKAKKRWNTDKGGGVYAVSSRGQVTGFRAGRMSKIFSGAFVMDDPLKPDDAYSDVKRQAVNNRFNNTIKSRIQLETVPIIIIMQRLHDNDFSGFLLEGGSGEKWHHLSFPSEITTEKSNENYPQNYTHGIPIKYRLKKGALWEKKHTLEQLQVLKKADIYTYSSQYMQAPAPIGGSIFKDEYWRLFTVLPKDALFMRIYADTAQEIKEANDFSVFQAWVYSPSKGIFLVDQAREKWESPQLETNMVAFWEKQKAFCEGMDVTLQVLKVEKKSSGSGLIQAIRQNTLIPIEAIERSRSKVSRAFDTVPQISVGNVHIYEKADWIFEYLDEFRKFTPMMTHAHDDQIDPTMDAISDMLITLNNLQSIKVTGT